MSRAAANRMMINPIMMTFGTESEMKPQFMNFAGLLSEIANKTIFLSFFGSVVVDRNEDTLLEKRRKRKRRQVNLYVR